MQHNDCVVLLDNDCIAALTTKVESIMLLFYDLCYNYVNDLLFVFSQAWKASLLISIQLLNNSGILEMIINVDLYYVIQRLSMENILTCIVVCIYKNKK